MENLPGNFKLMHFTYIRRTSCVELSHSTPSTLPNRHFHPEKAVLTAFVKYFELFPKKKAILERRNARPRVPRLSV
jgi:hypothetical protein